MTRRHHHRGRITQPAGKVELSAETRRIVAELKAAHHDDSVTIEEYMRLAVSVRHHLWALSEEERLEVAGQIIGATFGARYLGWGTR